MDGCRISRCTLSGSDPILAVEPGNARANDLLLGQFGEPAVIGLCLKQVGYIG